LSTPDVSSSDGEEEAGLLRPAIVLLAMLTLLTGMLYPLVLYGLAQFFFPHQSGGSLITSGGRIIGSESIGQSFTDLRYFWSWPSATSPQPDNAAASTGSNLGPLNPALREQMASRIAALRAADPANRQPVPIDLVTASGSGIDPDISIAAARYQMHRVARLRGLSADAVDQLIARLASRSQFGVLGSPRINVLALNLALDQLGRGPAPRNGAAR
jgi:K+-transporting ATPase ATPase C chain